MLSMGARGLPRFTDQSLKGPDLTQPPPGPGGSDTPHMSGEGIQVLLRPAWYAPFPDIDVSEPSKMGDFSGSWAHNGQL